VVFVKQRIELGRAMKTSVFLLGLILFALLGICDNDSKASSSSATYRQDGAGLEKQFEPFLKAYHKGDTEAQAEAFKVFQFPDPESWFGQYFRPEDVQQLVRDAETEAVGEGETLAGMMNIIKLGARFRARCKPHANGETGTVKERQNSVHPVRAVPVEQFDIEFQVDDSGSRFSFLINSVYVDGAYRYVGKGELPFWLMPDANTPDKDTEACQSEAVRIGGRQRVGVSLGFLQ
jgi:hypothetical protein